MPFTQSLHFFSSTSLPLSLRLPAKNNHEGRTIQQYKKMPYINLPTKRADIPGFLSQLNAWSLEQSSFKTILAF
jgi:hypothetical protein